MCRWPRGALLAGVGALVVACGSVPPPTFHPEAANPAGADGAAGPSSSRLAQTASQRVTWPPFGRNVHVIMPAWLPADRSEVPAVITAKNFLLAFLYAEYKGNKDHRWAIYVTVQVSGALTADLVINKPLGLSPRFIEFKRAHLYDINPVGVGALALSVILSSVAFLGLLGTVAQILAPFVALFSAFIAAPLIAWATRGKYYLARQPSELPGSAWSSAPS